MPVADGGPVGIEPESMSGAWKRRFGAVLIATVIACVATACSGSSAESLRILVSNDDGVEAEGIDLLVEALLAQGYEVVVSAPNGNRSGTSDWRGPSEFCGELSVEQGATRSGYPATSIDGCPADAVAYGLTELFPGRRPHLVIAGLNEGPNLCEQLAGGVSGTVGAARTAARLGMPALAASQATTAPGEHADFASGVESVVSWVQEHESILMRRGIPASITNMNTPTCEVGEIRGVVRNMPLAIDCAKVLDPQDCLSDVENPTTDVEALINGFVSIGPIPID